MKLPTCIQALTLKLGLKARRESKFQLIKAIRMRVVDSSFLRLIRMWLKCAIIEQGHDRKIVAFRSNKGTPQGGLCEALHNP
jgi:hypothetical protein